MHPDHRNCSRNMMAERPAVTSKKICNCKRKTDRQNYPTINAKTLTEAKIYSPKSEPHRCNAPIQKRESQADSKEATRNIELSYNHNSYIHSNQHQL